MTIGRFFKSAHLRYTRISYYFRPLARNINVDDHMQRTNHRVSRAEDNLSILRLILHRMHTTMTRRYILPLLLNFFTPHIYTNFFTNTANFYSRLIRPTRQRFATRLRRDNTHLVTVNRPLVNIIDRLNGLYIYITRHNRYNFSDERDKQYH